MRRAALTLTLPLFLACSLACAQCATLARTTGLRIVPAAMSLADLTIVIAPDQEANIRPSTIALLEGPCAQDLQAFRMSQIAFRDGAIFQALSSDRFIYVPDMQSLKNARGNRLFSGHPDIAQAQFIASDTVDGGYGKPSLDIGVWKTADGYLVAAFLQEGSGYAAPIPVLRTKEPIASVTYFPAPDSNSGRLALVQHTASGVVMVSLDWNHNALSRRLRASNGG